jgi:hypothetical protein|tara:strand:- start:1007 stop:1297 length:291 start_codon:yes stop_codon:yes gene_type:complete
MDSDIEGFLNANKSALLKIHKKESEERGEGILHITKNVKENKIDVLYLEISQIPENLKNDINTKKESLNKDKKMIFIFISNEDKETLLEIEVKEQN